MELVIILFCAVVGTGIYFVLRAAKRAINGEY